MWNITPKQLKEPYYRQAESHCITSCICKFVFKKFFRIVARQWGRQFYIFKSYNCKKKKILTYWNVSLGPGDV